MRLVNLISLIGGELQNRPIISQITGFSASLESVKPGVLFFARNRLHIPQAIAKGAYAIVYETDTSINDEEIAWIKVANLELAALKLIRFLLITNSAQLFSFSNIALEFAQLIIEDRQIAILQNPFDFIDHYQQEKIVLLSNSLLSHLALDAMHPPRAEVKIVQKLLFETSFLFQDRYYERIRVSPLFFTYFQEVLGFIDAYNIPFDFEKIKLFPHFSPHFIDNSFRVCEFGKSDRVIITEPNCKLLPKEAEFLQEYAPWAKKLYFTFDCNIKNFVIIDIAKLPQVFHTKSFTYILVQDFDIRLLAKRQEQKTLL